MWKLTQIVFWALIIYACVQFYPAARVGLWELRCMQDQIEWRIAKIGNVLDGRR